MTRNKKSGRGCPPAHRPTVTAAWVAVWLMLASGPAAGRPRPSAEELADARAWVASHLLAGPETLPFSFLFDGRASAEWLGSWPRKHTARRLDDQRTEHRLQWDDPATGLQLRCVAVAYHDFATVEWTVYLKNNGTQPTPILKEVLALDTVFHGPVDADAVLHHHRGSLATRSDYEPLRTLLKRGARVRLAPAGGRPSNGVWPYFNLHWADRGWIVVIGWPGQWAGEFVRHAPEGLRIQAGQETTHLRLMPGESIRTPRVVLQLWRGDRLRAQNLWRRWMMAHSMPRPGGKLPPPQFVASSSRAYGEMIGANEENQIMHIKRYLEEGLRPDYWWMDAGWYIQQHGWPQVGTWEVDPRRFPRGFRPISDFAHAHGVKILVWFEPERVMPGTWLYEHHPEWLLTPWGAGAHPLSGMRAWRSKQLGGPDPNVSRNTAKEPRATAGIVWQPGRLSLHPGPKGEFSVVRFTAPRAGQYSVQTRFQAIDRQTTTDVHVLHNGEPVWDGWIRLHEQGNEAAYQDRLNLEKGDQLDFVVGFGNGSYVCDSTGLEATITDPAGNVFDAAGQFHATKNPAGPWCYGWLKADHVPDASSFSPYDVAAEPAQEGPRLLNLGNAEARAWLVEHIDQLLVSQGIDLYRQDFNIDPLPFWRAADAADRQGITQNKYVCGFLAYWDELRRRRPTMLIDSCASGGRRNDLETMRRSVPLWRSDYAFEPIGHQCMTYGLSFWLPYHGTGTVAYAGAPYYGSGPTPVDSYAFWSNAAPSLGCGIDIRIEELEYDVLRRLYRQFRQVSPLYYGDYYPLTPYSQSEATWIAWQFDSPESGRGMVQAFRRPKCPQDQKRFRLHGLNAAAPYRVTDLAGNKSRVVPGRQLLEEGLAVSRPNCPAAAVILYERIASP